MSSPFTPPEADQQITPPSAIELLWTNHRGGVIGVALGVVVAVLVALGIMAYGHANRSASEALLSTSTNPEGWNRVISEYPRSAAAGNAMLLLAASLRDEGKIEESDALYSRYSETFPRSPLAISGLLGRASNARITNKPDAALASYQQAAAAYPQSYGAPFALFAEARLLAQSGKTEEVKRILQTLGSQYPLSVSAQVAGLSPNAAR